MSEKEYRKKEILKYYKPELYHDNFQNYKVYNIPKAQLVIADIPYNIGIDAYASSPSWYKDGDNSNGESDKAKSSFFSTDGKFNLIEYLHFCSTMLKAEPKEKGKAGCMIIFCSFEQQFMLIENAKKYGFPNYINLIFRKNYSAQVLKANMKIVGNCEYAVLFYRDKLPKFNNQNRMIFNCMEYPRDNSLPKVHPTQKSVILLQRLIEIFTDKGDVVIDPVAGSGTTLYAAALSGRKGIGFEVSKKFYNLAQTKILNNIPEGLF